MCLQCDYPQLIKKTKLDATPNRLKVLELIGNHDSPLSAGEIFTVLSTNQSINRVTVYRILDLLVAKGLVDRISGGGRSFYYGLAANENHAPPPHFYCTRCGAMECLSPESLQLNTDLPDRIFPGKIENVEIRFNGICECCMAMD